jgi:hypothetical protein
MLVGLIDGDGYLKVIKSTGGHLQVEMVLSLDIKDLLMLEYIQSVLGFGRVKAYPNIHTAKLIFGRVELQQIFFPLFLHHNLFFLTDTRRAQFNRMMYVFTHNVTRFIDVPASFPSFNPIPTTAAGFVQLPFFADWTVGFTVAEGSFYVKASGELFFSLRQRAGKHIELFDAFKILFNTNLAVENDGKYLKYAVSFVVALSSVVNFFSFSGHQPLIGLKAQQYALWISKINK